MSDHRKKWRIGVCEERTGNLKKTDYDSNPLKDGSLKGYKVHKLPITTLNRHSLAGIKGLSAKDIDRCKNLFAWV